MDPLAAIMGSYADSDSDSESDEPTPVPAQAQAPATSSAGAPSTLPLPDASALLDGMPNWNDTEPEAPAFSTGARPLQENQNS